MLRAPRPVYASRSDRAPRRRPVRQDTGVYSVAGVLRFGGSGGTGYQKDAGWGAEPADARSGWEAVGG
jgi:hypothetical protein